MGTTASVVGTIDVIVGTTASVVGTTGFVVGTTVIVVGTLMINAGTKTLPAGSSAPAARAVIAHPPTNLAPTLTIRAIPPTFTQVTHAMADDAVTSQSKGAET